MNYLKIYLFELVISVTSWWSDYFPKPFVQIMSTCCWSSWSRLRRCWLWVNIESFGSILEKVVLIKQNTQCDWKYSVWSIVSRANKKLVNPIEKIISCLLHHISLNGMLHVWRYPFIINCPVQIRQKRNSFLYVTNRKQLKSSEYSNRLFSKQRCYCDLKHFWWI